MRIDRSEPEAIVVTRVPCALATPAKFPEGFAATNPIPNQDTASVRSDRQAAPVNLADQCRSRIEGLSPRQRDVLTGLVAGHSNKQIARTLGISPRTIEVYRAGLMDRLKARTLAQVLQTAFLAGITLDTVSLGFG
ncbi:LuxR C-terminal-related transcriptional regulator [Sphingomonas sp. LT1P40]|uniref:LuxR C-terminal-related transcriptional regulator n=1 Tax=Alteristakelama amylovorans TaxID=3096166 RepID=UPI002FCB8404